MRGLFNGSMKKEKAEELVQTIAELADAIISLRSAKAKQNIECENRVATYMEKLVQLFSEKRV